MPAPPGNRSNLLVGNTLAISKKRNNKKLQSNALNCGGARKLAVRKPTISSMAINCGSFCFKIPALLVDTHMAQKIDAISINTARGKLLRAKRLSASENGMATRVPMVPGHRGKYPAPAPVTRNSTALCENVFTLVLLRSKGKIALVHPEADYIYASQCTTSSIPHERIKNVS
jgi:hypothetical protein